MRKPVVLILLCIVMALVYSCGSKRSASRRQEQAMPSSTVAAIVREAERWIGTPYRYGWSQRRKGTDCSGMVMVIYQEKAGVRLPRNSAGQQQFCQPLQRSELQPGDLVFFSPSTRRRRVSHVGIYIGNDRFIHASASRGVMISELSQRYFDTHFHSAGRVRQLATETVASPSAASLDTTIAEHARRQTVERAQVLLDSIIEAYTDSVANMR